MPNSQNEHYQDSDLSRLVGQIAQLEDETPPPGLTAAVMERIQPRKSVWWKRVLRRSQLPMAFAPVKILTGTMALVLIFGLYILLQRDVRLVDEVQTRVIFRLDHSAAQSVAVIGTFNHWNPDGYQMHRVSPEAPWQLPLDLTNGQYAYAFLIDNQQVVPDPHALLHQADGFGNINSKLIVGDGRKNANDI